MPFLLFPKKKTPRESCSGAPPGEYFNTMYLRLPVFNWKVIDGKNQHVIHIYALWPRKLCCFFYLYFKRYKEYSKKLTQEETFTSHDKGVVL